MTTQLSMREAARVMGVSQIRVRELIRKGTLAAEKVTDDAGERWQILQNSVTEYLDRRASQNGNSGEPAAAVSGSVETLIDGLESQLGRVRELISEIRRGQAFLDGLRATERGLATDLAQAKRKLSQAATPQAQAPAPEPKKAEPEPKKAEPQKTEAKKPAPAPKMEQKAPKTPETKKAEAKPAATKAAAKPQKPSAPKSDTKIQKGETVLAAALRDAGMAADKPAAKGGKSSGSKKPAAAAKGKKPKS